jgi:REP element-mobilizing transposase RayT
MVRGLERRPIFRDDADRRDFCARVGALVDAAALTVYAWALLPNHAHLLLRTGQRPLARCMRSLLTGYAGAFNRRHKRVGHLFQNRYKSIVVEEEPYLLELVRYLHLNPLRTGVVTDLRSLDRYPWTGHSALLGYRPCPWQAAGAILQQFGPTPARARKAYRTFVADGIPRGRSPELQGGGLIRSLGGWRAVAGLRRGREAYLGDERILGGAEFVEQCRREATHAGPPRARRPVLATLLTRVCAATGCSPPALHHGSRRARAARAREGLAYLALEVYGYAGPAVADLLGVRPPAVYRAAQRGRANRGRWDRLLTADGTERNTRKQRPG